MSVNLDSVGHYKVGYICGVYDLFHVGHLNILRRCKEHCDYLIVGIDSDDLTEVYKSRRPVINERDRMEIVRGIKYVDEVVLVDFHNDSPQLAWDLYHFDVQFCGDDHESALQDAKKYLRERGSDMVFFPYTKGISTTQLRTSLGEKSVARPISPTPPQEQPVGYISGLFESIDNELVQTLLWCKQQCARLVVGLYTDDFALRLLDKPAALDYERRAALVKAFAFVDDVVPVDWNNAGKKESFLRMKYGVAFYGAEYGTAFESDKNFFANNGVRFLPLPFQKLRLFANSLEALLKDSPDRDIVLFGTGNFFDLYMDRLGEKYTPVYAIDNDQKKWGKKKHGVKIYGIEKLKEKGEREPLVIVCVKNCAAILNQLKSFGGIDYRSLFCNDRFALCDEYSLQIAQESEYMKETHRLLMILLVEFDRVCKKYGIKYFLNDGSLIGVVRHQALIPWDDDADVSMFREDYEKLRSVADKEWGGGDFEFVPPDGIGKNVFHDFMSRLAYKKEGIKTNIFSKSQKKMRPDLRDAMCLDIYVLDNRSKDEKTHGKQAFMIKTLYGLAMGHRQKIDYDEYKGQKFFVRLAIRFLAFAGKLVPLKAIFSLYDKVCKKYSSKNAASGFVYESNAPLCCLMTTFDKKLFGYGTFLKVYGHDIMVPERYCDYLETHGYHNFMQYPPANMRKPSHSPKSPGIMYKLG